MNRWNQTSARPSQGSPCFDRWAERTRSYLRSRTADHWLMFVGGFLLGAFLA